VPWGISMVKCTKSKCFHFFLVSCI
jgi:hypothetical protein